MTARLLDLQRRQGALAAAPNVGGRLPGDGRGPDPRVQGHWPAGRPAARHYLERRGAGAATILVETSATRGPRPAAVRSPSRVSIFWLYPHGRVSPRLQLTTVDAPNVRVFHRGDTDEQAEALKQTSSTTDSCEFRVCSIN